MVTTEGKEVGPLVPISSLGPGAQRSLRFHLHLDHGDWSLTANTMSGSLDLGPFACDMEYEAPKGRKLANAMGSSLFSGAFEGQLDEFGQVAERGLIDASSVQMTSFSAENAEGGATTIRAAGTFGHAEEEARRPRHGPAVLPHRLRWSKHRCQLQIPCWHRPRLHRPGGPTA